MLVQAYPSLQPQERVLLTTYLTQVFRALGIPQRPHSYVPEQVVRTFMYQFSE